MGCIRCELPIKASRGNVRQGLEFQEETKNSLDSKAPRLAEITEGEVSQMAKKRTKMASRGRTAASRL